MKFSNYVTIQKAIFIIPFFFEVIKIKGHQLHICYIVSALKRSHIKLLQVHILCKSFRRNASLERQSILNTQLRYS